MLKGLAVLCLAFHLKEFQSLLHKGTFRLAGNWSMGQTRLCKVMHIHVEDIIYTTNAWVLYSAHTMQVYILHRQVFQ